MKRVLFIVLTFTLGLQIHVAQAQTWSNIRDGVLHVRTASSAVVCNVQWKDEWISESQHDHIYIQNPDGSLLKRLNLSKENTPGTENISLTKSGDTRIDVTGYNFRTVNVSLPDSIPSVFEPVKVHKSITLGSGGKLYFKVPANRAFSFNGKYHDGISRFNLTSINDGQQLSLSLTAKDYYWEFDTLEIASAASETTWELSWSSSGKVSFWLDGIPNLFAQTPQNLFTPTLQTGTVSVSVLSNIVGTTPAIGAAMPFTAPPRSSFDLIKNWHLSTANHYAFVDALLKSPEMDLSFLKTYEKDLALKNSSVILSKSGRAPVLTDADEIAGFLQPYLKLRASQSLLVDAHIALADEPNLNYTDYAEFESYFANVAGRIKNSSDPVINKTRFAVPESSRFLEGPTLEGSEKKIGIDWAEQLLTAHGNLIDAISWHEWMVRDLIDTGRYKTSVEAAANLAAKHENRLHKKLDLIITQTNISSGLSLSSYEQDTWFASLWWASVVIQSSLPGQLDQLVWFKAADDGIYRKGLVSISNDTIVKKPVSSAMTFVSENLGKWVLENTGNHPELDLLATLSEGKDTLILLGVNKSKRLQKLSVQLPGNITNATIKMLQENTLSPVTLKQSEQSISADIPAESIFSIRMELKVPPLPPIMTSPSNN